MLKVREAAPSDLSGIGDLVKELGFHVSSTSLQANFDALTEQRLRPLVADAAKVVGCITYNVTPVLHRPTLVGRITMLVVADDWRGRGVGRLLMEAATERLRERGCRLCEVTSAFALVDAHAFYECLGYEKTSVRLVRSI